MNQAVSKGVLAIVVASTVAAPVAAIAATAVSFEGADYSINSNDRSRISACDLEADGRGVHADYLNSGLYGRIDNGNGSQGGCGDRNLGSLRVTQHRIVEEINFAPDLYGAWAYPKP